MDIPVAHVNGARDMGSGPVASLYAPSSPGSEGGVLVQLLYGRRRIDRLIWGGGWGGALFDAGACSPQYPECQAANTESLAVHWGAERAIRHYLYFG